MGSLYLNNRLLYVLVGTSVLFCLGFPYPIFMALGQISLLVIGLLVIIELSLLYALPTPVEVERHLEEKLSNGDVNPITLSLTSRYAFISHMDIIDEFPIQLQLRNQKVRKRNLPPKTEQRIEYGIRPTERGVYGFGQVHVFVSSQLALVKRRLSFDLNREVKVYPSFIQAKKYSFLALNNRLEESGLKKIRKIGANNEFEQIREYVIGDDFRTINWKASARNNGLMVNQYQEEKSQNVYCLVDKGRLMHMPFEGLSLMDYAINSSLVMSNIALGKSDRAGLVTFSDKIGVLHLAQSKRSQMSLIADSLYDQETRLKESDFARLYRNLKLKVKKRSLMILFTNFDSMVTLNRQLKYLKAIGREHLLCVVVFDNTEINQRANEPSYNLVGAYEQGLAERAQHDKRLIVKALNQNGIYTILTEPENLTINTINKYLELKARAAI